MSLLSFQNPAGLLLLPLAAAPLIIHWLQREKSRVIPFPSVQLLKAAPSRSWRRERIRQWLLLATRALLLLCLILLISGPRTSLPLPAWMSPFQGSVVMILDDSASMSAREGGASLFDQARQQAQTVVSRLSGNSRVAVISGAPGSKIITGFVSPGRAGPAIRSSAPTEMGTDLCGALLAADRMLQGRPGETIIVFSDLMKHGFARPPLPALESGADIVLMQCGGDSTVRNLCWKRVEHYPLNRKLLVEGQVFGQLGPDLSLHSGGRTVAGAMARPDSGGAFAVSFAWDGAEPGFLQGPPDGLPADDRYYLAPGRLEGLEVLLLEDGHRPAHFKKALAALARAGYQVRGRSRAEDQDLSRYRLIIISGPTVTVPVRAVCAAVESGSGLLLVPSGDALPHSYNLLLACLHPELRLRETAGGDHLQLDVPPGRYFTGISPRDLRHVAVHRFWKLDGAAAGPLMVQGSGPAYLSFGFGSGQAGLWLLGTEPEMTDIGHHPIFLPLLDQICRQLAGSGSGQYHTGQLLSLPGLKGLTGPDGRQVPPAANEKGQRYWLLEKAGWYRGEQGNSERLLAVNIPIEESQTGRMNDRLLAEALGPNPWGRGLSRIMPTGGSRPLMAPLLLLAGLLLLLELFLRSEAKNILKKRLTT
jgi:hypothetical protein